MNSKEVVIITYTNYHGETGVRQIIPKRLWFGQTKWHPEDQWMLDAFDIGKNAERSFAIKDIQDWVATSY